LAVLFAAVEWVGWAGITPVSQVRSVEAEAFADLPIPVVEPEVDSDFDSANDFSPFLAEVQSEAADFFAPPLALRLGQGTAKQDSKIGPIVISAKGEASVQLTLIPGSISGGSSRAEAESGFDVTFSVDVPSLYFLTGLLDTQAITVGGAAVPNLNNDLSFWDLDGSTLLFRSLTDDESFSVSGLLEPGHYRILANAGVSANQASAINQTRSVTGLSSFELRLLVTNVPESNSVLAWIGLGGLVGCTWMSRRFRV